LRQEHVLISAHGNSLRAIIKHVFGLSNAEIMDIEVPTGNPLLIDLDEDLRPISAVYLDPERAMKVPEIG
jgi:2,3-bisphosphoglycerate-dependent phosphoglycerate mutase